MKDPKLLLELFREIPELTCTHARGNRPKEWDIFKRIFGDDLTWLDFCHIREFFWFGGVNVFAPSPDDLPPARRNQYDLEGCFLYHDDEEYGCNKIALFAKMLYGAALTSTTFQQSVDFDTVHTVLKDFLNDLNANGLTPYQIHTRY